MAGPPASDTTTAAAASRQSGRTPTSTSTSPTPTPTQTTSSSTNRKTSSAFITSAGSPASTPASSAASPPSNAPTPSSSHSHSTGAQPPPHLSIRPAVTRTLSAASPVSAGSPVNKMAMSSVISPMPQSPGANAKMPISMTSKEWVIPPRPKPGRKPATDTPPTKRKAQNRAAQRAFRERRAARVGELEEQLDAEKEQHDKNERELRDRIHNLEMEAQSLQTRCQMLENMLDRQKADHAKELDAARRDSMSGRHGSLPPIQQHPDSHRGSYYSHHSSRGSTSSPRHTPSRRSSAQPFSISQIISPPDEVDIEAPPISCGSCTSSGACACVDEVLATEAVGCGKCTLGSRCECLEETIKATVSALPTASGSDLKRPLPPGSPNSVAPHEKRLRSEASIETDFTSLFSSRRRDSTASQMSVTSSPYAPVPVSISQQQLAPILRSTEDKCGFCKDGTYCVCADTSLTLPSILPISQQTHTPPPSETDAVPMEIQADGAVKLRRTNNGSKKASTPVSTTGSRCGPGGPGTCAQCLADPKSGLFCRALSANFSRKNGSGESAGGCCGGGGAGGCCKSKPPTASTLARAQVQSSLGLSLSCADAYKTLASHRHFDEAADDIGAWLPLLKAAPSPISKVRVGLSDREGGEADDAGRTPIEVEAASIMSVLKGFDVRFGQ